MNREQLQEHENKVMAQMVWMLTYPGLHVPDEVSTSDLIRFSKYEILHNRLQGMGEREIRNALRRMKHKGLIQRAWQKQNPDQPSGEYGEVWSDDPFIPHHGYAPTNAGWETPAAQEAKAWVDKEWQITAEGLIHGELPEDDDSFIQPGKER